MARTCDQCGQLIEQRNDEYLQLTVHVMNATENDDQDAKASRYADFCDGCISDGSALTWLLKEVDWTLEPSRPADAVDPHATDPGTLPPRDPAV